MTKELDDIDNQLAVLKKRRDVIIAEKRQAAVEDVRAIIAQYEIKAKECGFTELPSKKGNGSKAPVEAKYRNTTNNDETWSGRGRKPKWLEEAIRQGKSLEDFKI